jgi:hypothetical protein
MSQTVLQNRANPTLNRTAASRPDADSDRTGSRCRLVWCMLFRRPRLVTWFLWSVALSLLILGADVMRVRYRTPNRPQSIEDFEARERITARGGRTITVPPECLPAEERRTKPPISVA